MTKKMRRRIDSAVKAKIALEAGRDPSAGSGGDGGGFGPAPRGLPKPDLRLEEAASGERGAREADEPRAKTGQLTEDGSTSSP
jgi:hypothetical protein